MEVENTSGKDSGNYLSFAKTGTPESFLILCLGRELREMAGGGDGNNDQEHLNGPLRQPHTQSTFLCLFSPGPPGTPGREVLWEGDIMGGRHYGREVLRSWFYR